MAKHVSAGILLYRTNRGPVEVFLVHPGGPYWAGKDDGAWSIPKGICQGEEDPLAAAKREFQEETGMAVTGRCRPLTPLRQPSGKVISVWAVEGDLDAGRVRSNVFSMEWPPHSGRMQEFPEVDRGAWFDLVTARRKLLPGQRPFLDQLEEALSARGEA